MDQAQSHQCPCGEGRIALSATAARDMLSASTARGSDSCLPPPHDFSVVSVLTFLSSVKAMAGKRASVALGGRVAMEVKNVPWNPFQTWGFQAKKDPVQRLFWTHCALGMPHKYHQKLDV